MKRNLLKTVSLLLLLSLMTGCAGKTPEHIPVVDPIDDDYRVFYEIFVGSFSDSDGDGTGDLRGIINRMDYLNDGDITSGKSLGIQGIWLSPSFKSPSYHKYDVADYYRIDEAFGTEEDLTELLGICHERNVKVILDLVINHSSTECKWFKKFAEAHEWADTGNEYYDFYSWATKETMAGGLTYSQIPGTENEYYECNFSGDMPELNFNNEKVREQMLDVAKYWLDKGVDGFRFDAVKYISYGNTAESVDFWKWYADELRAYKPDIYCVGECWSGDSEILKYNEAMNCFAFQMAQAEGYIAGAAKGQNIDTFTTYVENYQKNIEKANAEYGMVIPFISNHDMDRAAGYLTLASGYADVGATLYILSPGSPFIYYGEEIGAKGTRGSSETDANRRLSMNWGDEDTVTDPEGADYPRSKQTNGTVASQTENPDSLYNHYCRLIAVRSAHPEIARGSYKALKLSKGSNFGGFLIEYEGKTTLLLHNTGDEEITIDLLTVPELSGFKNLSDFVGKGEAVLTGTVLTVPSRTSVIMN